MSHYNPSNILHTSDHRKAIKAAMQLSENYSLLGTDNVREKISQRSIGAKWSLSFIYVMLYKYGNRTRNVLGRIDFSVIIRLKIEDKYCA